ncbi:MAG: hypothetical protein QGG50_01280, partial [Methanopyri archaeon]|nr:hypothetical protein [Methanopyri archaeon]
DKAPAQGRDKAPAQGKDKAPAQGRGKDKERAPVPGRGKAKGRVLVRGQDRDWAAVQAAHALALFRVVLRARVRTGSPIRSWSALPESTRAVR